MKKILAILLALILVLANVAALAEEAKYNPSTAFTFKPLPKEYEVIGASDEALYPQETLSFTVTAAEDNPDGGDAVITVGANADNKVAVTGVNGNDLQINVPAFSLPGLYHFTIKEVEGNTQGVTYNTDTEIGISVLVTFNADDAAQLEVVNTADLKNFGITAKGEGENKEKVEELTNKYELGSLTVSKEVTGNLGDRNQLFDIKVTFEAEGDVLSDITVETESTGTNPAKVAMADWENGTAEVDIQLKHGESLTFKDIPANVTYTVVEDEKHAADDPNGADGSTGYTVTYDGDEGEIAAGETSEASITNDKNITIDTGVALESVPYIMILAVTMIGAALLVLRKREEY